MFGFPHSLPTREKEEGADSEHVMLPPALSSDYETARASNGILHSHEPANSPTCCQQLRGDWAAQEKGLISLANTIIIFNITVFLMNKNVVFGYNDPRQRTGVLFICKQE